MLKKLFKFISFVIFLIIILVIGLVCYIGYSIHDTTDGTDPTIAEENRSLSELNSCYMYDALANTKTTDVVDYNLNETELNAMLYSISKKINVKFFEISSIYSVYNSDGTISLYMPAKYLFFKTRVKTNLVIEKDDQGVTFTLDKIGLGKLDSDNFLIKNFVLPDLNSSSLEKQLKKNNIYTECDVKGSKVVVYMNNENIINTVDAINNEYHSLYSAIAGEILSKNLASLKFNVDNELAVDLKIQDMKTSCAYNTYNNLVKEKTLQLLDNGQCDYKNISLAYDFLVRGYEVFSDKDKEKLAKIDFTTIGIIDYKKYSGIIDASYVTMADVIKDNMPKTSDLPAIILKGEHTIKITAERITEILSNIDMVGKSYTFAKGGDYVYITITNFKCEIEDNILKLRMIIDVNGTPVDIVLKLHADKTNSLKIETTIDSIYFGSLESNEATKKEVISYLYEATKDENLEFIQFSEDGTGVTIDFTTYFNSSITSVIEALSNKEVYLSSEDNGEIIIKCYK